MRILVIALSVCFGLSVASALAAPEPATDDQKTLYVLGIAISQSLGNFSLSEAELDFVKAGITDGVLGRKARVDVQAFMPRVQKLQQARGAALADKEKKAGEAFLARAAAEKGATKTASGIVIQAMKEGKGASPREADSVKVHYHGTLVDGTVFDSSVQRGEPATFPLQRVIPCWTEGVQQIKVGGKSRLICPSSLAYGDRGQPPAIKPGATLVFEVELLEIVKK
jgi:FKBP-type peptidyl-prolyl cis-trans isomerase FkpA/FKBP-type peptidyl-prolyl cis-trans isomerase FklB